MSYKDTGNKAPECSDGPVKDDKSRRRTLKALAGGAGAAAGLKFVPEHWVKPGVSTVILPAHAQTSPQGKDPQDEDPQDKPIPFSECFLSGFAAVANEFNTSTGTEASEITVVEAQFPVEISVEGGFPDDLGTITVTPTGGGSIEAGSVSTEYVSEATEGFSFEFNPMIADVSQSGGNFTEGGYVVEVSGTVCSDEATADEGQINNLPT